MASLNSISRIAVPMYAATPDVVLMVHGKPGMGKSDLCYQIAHDLDIPEDRILRVHVNNHDVVDFNAA